jgi:uncharacterized DUF497 family protein
LDFADLTLGFLAMAGVREAKRGRLRFIGRIDATHVVAIIIAPLGTEALGVVSMRLANKQERRYVR